MMNCTIIFVKCGVDQSHQHARQSQGPASVHLGLLPPVSPAPAAVVADAATAFAPAVLVAASSTATGHC